jgi:hypothetical protein
MDIRNEELHKFYSSPDIRMNKPRWIRWVEHVARVELQYESLKEKATRQTWILMGG